MLGQYLLALLGHVLKTSALSDISPGYDDPAVGGGEMVTTVPDTLPAGLAEPINIIISNHSSPRVLAETMSNGGLYNYMMAVGQAPECLGFHMGNKQSADLGDGAGLRMSIMGEAEGQQRAILRWMYFGDPYFGTCLETIYGGTHARFWRQETSGAWFLSASDELNMQANHNIPSNGYDVGRDQLSGNATGLPLSAEDMLAGHRVSGVIRYGGWAYNTTVEYVSGLAASNRTDINHYSSVQQLGLNVTDGLVAVWTVTVLGDV